eukprot:Rhum_TRINITY_DN17485_c0_g1::Rhum_TRINITY_DN17485_c0_g1_i1::g.165912::m.165912
MLRRTEVALRHKQRFFLRAPLSEKNVQSHINMDRIYRNLAMEKREYRRPWTFEKDMRGSVMHVTNHSPLKPEQWVGTVMDVSHNETNIDAWVRLFVRRGKSISWVRFPLMNPVFEYKIVRDKDEVKIWENFVKELGHQQVIYRFGKNSRTRSTDSSMFWA